MIKLPIALLTTLLTITNPAAEVPQPQPLVTEPIVQLETTYTYEEMLVDSVLLNQAYPEFIQYEEIGQSLLHRPILCLRLGNPDAERRILVQTGQHAREYVAPQVCMALVEYYASAYARGEMLDMCNDTCFYIVPMVNPDGICYVQLGIDSVPETEPELRAFVLSRGHRNLWKANIRGIDLNRQFDARWDTVNMYGYTGPDFEMFKGYAPMTEPEAQALCDFATNGDFDCFINFHQQGNVIFKGSSIGLPEINAKSTQLAYAIAASNHYYVPAQTNTIPSYGTFADYVVTVLGKPSVTLEFGKKLPPAGQVEAKSIFDRNKEVFAIVRNNL